MEIVIYYLNGNDSSIQSHYLQKEYRDDIIISINNAFYEVYFFTKDSLGFEMRKDGFFSIPGIIILEEISCDKIINAINVLVDLGYFDSFLGKVDFNPNDRFLKKWYYHIEDHNYIDCVAVKLR